MATLTIELPDDMFAALCLSPEEVNREIRIAAAIRWYGEKRISQGKGAEIARLPRAAFIDELARRQISVSQIRPEELWNEIPS